MQTRLQKNQQSCVICYEKVNIQGQIQSCQHIFCMQCIQTWSKTQNSCPVCKRRFNTIKPVQKRVNYTQSKKKKIIKKQQIVTVRQKNQHQHVQFHFNNNPFISLINSGNNTNNNNQNYMNSNRYINWRRTLNIFFNIPESDIQLFDLIFNIDSIFTHVESQ